MKDPGIKLRQGISSSRPLAIINRSISVQEWHRGNICTFQSVALGSILGVPKDFFLTEIYSLNVAKIDRQHCTA